MFILSPKFNNTKVLVYVMTNIGSFLLGPLCPCGVGFAEVSVPTANSSVNLGLTKLKLVKTSNTTESN